jgi:hypothetical protein
MWHRVEVVLTDVSEERIASIFRVEGKIKKSAREASVRDVKSSLHSHHRENLKSDICKIPLFYGLSNVAVSVRLHGVHLKRMWRGVIVALLGYSSGICT